MSLIFIQNHLLTTYYLMVQKPQVKSTMSNKDHKVEEELPEEFNATHSYFIGPKGANLPDFRANINTILDELLEARQNYYPDDHVISLAVSLQVLQCADTMPIRNSFRNKFDVRPSLLR